LRKGIKQLIQDEKLGRVLVATANENVVGIAIMSFVFTIEHGGHSAWLDELYVHSDWRESGIGTRLLEIAIQTAQEANCLAIDLEVDIEHRRAENLYQRYGFRKHKRVRWYLPL